MSRATLIRAILDNGLRNYVYLASPKERMAHARMVRAEAEVWVTNDSHQPGTFLWCCRQLGLDPDEIRSEANERRNPRRKSADD